MERKVRRHHNPVFKAKVALEALREQKTLSQIADQYSLHINQISDWRKSVVERLPELFEKGALGSTPSPDSDVDSITGPLYQQIGQQKVELDFLKKKLRQLER